MCKSTRRWRLTTAAASDMWTCAGCSPPLNPLDVVFDGEFPV